MKPVTRMEMLFDAIAKCDPVDFKPENRMEAWLCKLSEPPSWNDLSDKPIQEVGGLTVVFDGNIEGLSVVGNTFYKLSDIAPTMDDFANGVTVSVHHNREYIDTPENETYEFKKEDLIEIDFFNLGVTNIQPKKGPYFLVFPEDTVFHDNTEIKKGLYFLNDPNSSTCISVAINAKEIINPNYLPKAAAVADVTEAPTAENFNALLASLRAAGYLSE